MRTCSNCLDCIIKGRNDVPYKQTTLCKNCYRIEQSYSFKKWYDKQPKNLHTKTCIMCLKEFQSSQSKATVCSVECRKERRKQRERIRRKLK